MLKEAMEIVREVERRLFAIEERIAGIEHRVHALELYDGDGDLDAMPELFGEDEQAV